MAFILDIPGDVSNPEEFHAARKFFDAYDQYLKALGSRLPSSVREFALASWYKDAQSHQCPYDAWVESVQLVESAAGPSKDRRSLNIEIRLLGAYHDGHIAYKYDDVQNYALVFPVINERLAKAAHDGWRLDEIRVSPANNVIHEIAFKSGARWLIECKSITYSWLPLIGENSS